MKIKFVFLFLSVVGLLAQTNDPPVPIDGVPADLLGWVNMVIVALTPIIIAGLKWLAPKLPKIVLPFAAPIAGLLLEWLSTFVTGHDAQPVVGLIAGAIGLWLREGVDQVKKQIAKTSTQ